MPKTSSVLNSESSALRYDENPTRKLSRVCMLVYLILVIAVFAAIRVWNDGHFVYSLDDPYIHLAMAENLSRGHYGINAAEPSSPSSTIIWPFMLIPLAGTRWHSYEPLFWNVLFGLASSFLIGTSVARWMPIDREKRQSGFSKQVVTAVLLMFVANLVGLTFLGMEHSFQVFLAISCALGCIAALEGRPIPTWCLVAAVLAPSVRYEDLILTLAICLALIGQRERAKAAVVLGLSITPLVLFGLFLKSQGLPMLPTSVLVKGNVYSHQLSFPRALMRTVFDNLRYLNAQNRLLIFALFLIFVWLLWKEKLTARRYVFLGVVLAAGLQLAIGPFGWFYRYEDYALIFLTLILVRVVVDRPGIPFAVVAIGLLLLARPYIKATLFTVKSTHDVYGQQYQMHRFVDDYWHDNFAVNDLGWVSFNKPKDTYVLDVWGLASVEASRQYPKTAAWLDGIVRRHAVKLAILYPDWFKIPATWTPEAKICLTGSDPIIVSRRCTVFYSTTPDAAQEIHSDLVRFAPTLPQSVRMSFLTDDKGENSLKMSKPGL